jgi:hypothetical protein
MILTWQREEADLHRALMARYDWDKSVPVYYIAAVRHRLGNDTDDLTRHELQAMSESN